MPGHEPRGAATRRALRIASWLAALLIGQAVMLQLIDAGRTVGYQHYRLPSIALVEERPLLIALLVAQLVLVILAGAATWRDAWRWIAANLGGWKLIAVVAVFVFTGAALSRQPSVYAAELVVAAVLQALNLATLVLAVRALPVSTLEAVSRHIDRVLGAPTGPAPEPGGGDRFVLVAAASVTVVAALLSVVVYQRHPHVPDEVSYLLHARYLAEGQLAMPAPPVREAFDVDLMQHETGRWYSPVPPGWPAVLALGVLVGAPWLVNPLLAGVAVVLVYAFLRELYPRRTARLAVVLLCASPWFVFLAMSYMTHTLTLVCAALAALAVARVRRTRRLWWAVPGGAMIGVVSLVRPLEGFLLATLLGVWALEARRWRVRLAPVSLLALATILVGSLALVYNHALTGSATTFPIMAYTDALYGPGSNALGFGPERGLGWSGLDPFPGHGVRDVLVNAALNLFSTNVELLGWSTGSLLVVALAVVSGKLRYPDRLMVIAAAAVVGIHTFYWFAGGPDFGARYWYLALLPLLVLAARGIEILGDHGGAHVGRLHPRRAAAPDDPGRRRARAHVAALALCIAAVVTYFPWRSVDKYYHYRNMRPDVARLSRQRDMGRSLVLIRGNRHPDYASAMTYNPLDLRADVPIYAWDRDDATRARLLRAYRDRRVWIIDGPTRTRAGFRVVAGPVDAARLLRDASTADSLPPEGAAVAPY